ncbi:hypothetical protein AWM70_13145 [Paenibacillus yonginensis]|uniref:Uncharacterized protein n=1 Tax=Paenibacillus yonginensis TaxID=1462996 RepID=A0A1B1N1Z8_9BACL|nr:hypothetical protein AWM70_13145 [Paenibacillus yonginensis]
MTEELIAGHYGHVSPAVLVGFDRNDGILFSAEREAMDPGSQRRERTQLAGREVDPVIVGRKQLLVLIKNITAARIIVQDRVHNAHQGRFLH